MSVCIWSNGVILMTRRFESCRCGEQEGELMTEAPFLAGLSPLRLALWFVWS